MKIYSHHKIIAAVLISTAALAVGLLLLSNLPPSESQSATTPQPVASQPATITFEGVADQTVLAQLQSHRSVITSQSSYGTLVESIDGVKNGDGGKYWLFSVNGKVADKGADTYVTASGDTVTWTFEKS